MFPSLLNHAMWDNHIVFILQRRLFLTVNLKLIFLSHAISLLLSCKLIYFYHSLPFIYKTKSYQNHIACRSLLLVPCTEDYPLSSCFKLLVLITLLSLKALHLGFRLSKLANTCFFILLFFFPCKMCVDYWISLLLLYY